MGQNRGTVYTDNQILSWDCSLEAKAVLYFISEGMQSIHWQIGWPIPCLCRLQPHCEVVAMKTIMALPLGGMRRHTSHPKPRNTPTTYAPPRLKMWAKCDGGAQVEEGRSIQHWLTLNSQYQRIATHSLSLERLMCEGKVMIGGHWSRTQPNDRWSS